MVITRDELNRIMPTSCCCYFSPAVYSNPGRKHNTTLDHLCPWTGWLQFGTGEIRTAVYENSIDAKC